MPKPSALGVARVLMANRAPREWQASDLESLWPEGHRARIVWASVEQAAAVGRRLRRRFDNLSRKYILRILPNVAMLINLQLLLKN